MTSDRGTPSFSTGTIWMIPFRNSADEGFSGLMPDWCQIRVSLIAHSRKGIRQIPHGPTWQMGPSHQL